jgi:VIT1/CCC1 family predicted Fe2+/Mn2+ transporter
MDMHPESSPSPLLSPAQRASEIVFGVIMALSITAALSVGGASRETTRELLVAALACNLAWGMVDAAMYLLNTLIDRARRRKVARDLLATDGDVEFRAVLLRSGELGLAAETMTDEGARKFRQWLQVHGDGLPRGLAGADWLAALQIWLLVFGATLPLIVPFLVVTDPTTALRASQGVAVAMLFGLGLRLGRWTGARPLASGFWFATLGLAITIACIALGG